MIYVGNKKYSLYVGNKRREMIIPESLPYDAELEYIKTTGTQYINTGILVEPMSDGYAYGMTFTNAAYTRTMAGLWQYNFNTDNLAFIVVGNYRTSYFKFPKNWRGGDINLNGIPKLGNVGEYTEVSVINKGDWDGQQMTIGVTSPLYNGDIIFDNPYPDKAVFPFIIGAVWSGTGTPQEFSTLEIHYFKILRYNTPIFDAIPVRVGQTGYMYDKVSGQLFGNAGTGDFVLGPDKSPSILPSGYTQILGVKNTSTAYLPAPTINAGVRYELEIEATDRFGNGLFSYNSSGSYEIIVFFNGSTDSYLNGKFTLEGFSLNTKFKIVLDLAMESEYARLYINDELVRQTTLHVNIGSDIGIFKDLCRNTYVKGILYSFRGYKDDVLINDYIPAIRNSDGKVGVYDIASNEFITSPNDVDFEAVLQ